MSVFCEENENLEIRDHSERHHRLSLPSLVLCRSAFLARRSMQNNRYNRRSEVSISDWKRLRLTTERAHDAIPRRS